MGKIESLKCPECGGPLNFTDDQEFCYCSHCGHQVYKEDVHFDKRMEYKMAEMENETKLLKYIGIFLIFAIIGLLVMVLLVT